MILRDEEPGDIAAIHDLIAAAFQDKAFSNQREHFLMDSLRRDGYLTLSLVADDAGVIVGQVAFSPVTVDGVFDGWYGLGPVAVAPNRQKQGIGVLLIETGLSRLREIGAKGCVLLGDPAYYSRFGFRAESALRLPGFPPEYFQALAFDSPIPTGDVRFAPAFDEV